MLLSGWFGWSALWILPLLWRVCRAWVLKTASLRGQGSIRLWLGTLLAVACGSGLEALAYDPGPAFGSALSSGLASMVGTALTSLILLLLFTLALPWLFGTSLPGLLTRRPPPQTTRRIPSSGSGAAATGPVLPMPQTPHPRPGSGAATERRREGWRLPAPLVVRKQKDKFAAPIQTRTPSSEQPRTQWAPFESIRPTSAMLARERERAQQTSHVPEPLPTFARHIPGKTSGNSGTSVTRPPAPTQTSGPVQPPVRSDIMMPSAAPLPTTSAGFVEPEAPASMPVVEPVPQRAAEPTPEALPAHSGADHDFVPHLDEATTSYPPRPVYHGEPASSLPPPSPAAPSPPPLAPVPVPSPPTLSAHAVDLPGLDLLDRAPPDAIEIRVEELAETGQLIEQRLKEFKVPVTVLGACAGPVITRFEIEPAVGVRGAQIVGLMKDLSRALGLTSIRVVETIPGKTCMGLELPNTKRLSIRLSEMLESEAYRGSASRLTLAMGKDITGAPVTTDLARAPHMLVAGTTGSGKSVAINAMILSLLFKATPAEVRLIMIDPKMLELSVYDGIPHLLAPVVTDMKLAANALNWCVAEMEKRYRLMSALGVRNLAGYNQKIRDAEMRECKVSNPFSLTPDAPEPLSTLPMIVVVIDELADLMMVVGKKIEELIARLAQKARAAGIHLILATQRPSVDVITGLIKANIPTRVAFQVSSKIDSRTVLDQMGAESLLGHGDMLFLPPGSGYPQRVHGAFVSDEEVHRVVEFLKQFGEPDYEEAILAGPAAEDSQNELFGDDASPEADPLYDEAVAFVIRSRRASISAVQRQLRIGYNRAARLVEQMESAGILSSMATNGSREILVPPSTD